MTVDLERWCDSGDLWGGRCHVLIRPRAPLQAFTTHTLSLDLDSEGSFGTHPGRPSVFQYGLELGESRADGLCFTVMTRSAAGVRSPAAPPACLPKAIAACECFRDPLWNTCSKGQIEEKEIAPLPSWPTDGRSGFSDPSENAGGGPDVDDGPYPWESPAEPPGCASAQAAPPAPPAQGTHTRSLIAAWIRR